MQGSPKLWRNNGDNMTYQELQNDYDFLKIQVSDFIAGLSGELKEEAIKHFNSCVTSIRDFSGLNINDNNRAQG